MHPSERLIDWEAHNELIYETVLEAALQICS